MLSHGDTQYAKIWYAKVKKQRQPCKTKIHDEKIILIEFKGQGHTEVMNVRDTSYHGDTLTCQTYR